MLWHDVRQADAVGNDFNARLVVNSQNKLVFGAGHYTIMFCNTVGCVDRAEQGVSRVREAYYEPDLFGLALDDQDRVYVLTQDGQRTAYRLLIDRLPPHRAGSKRRPLLLDGDRDRPHRDPELTPDAAPHASQCAALGAFPVIAHCDHGGKLSPRT